MACRQYRRHGSRRCLNNVFAQHSTLAFRPVIAYALLMHFRKLALALFCGLSACAAQDIELAAELIDPLHNLSAMQP
jgi:hypothetical protein